MWIFTDGLKRLFTIDSHLHLFFSIFFLKSALRNAENTSSCKSEWNLQSSICTASDLSDTMKNIHTHHILTTSHMHSYSHLNWHLLMCQQWIFLEGAQKWVMRTKLKTGAIFLGIMVSLLILSVCLSFCLPLPDNTSIIKQSAAHFSVVPLFLSLRCPACEATGHCSEEGAGRRGFRQSLPGWVLQPQPYQGEDAGSCQGAWRLIQLTLFCLF